MEKLRFIGILAYPKILLCTPLIVFFFYTNLNGFIVCIKDTKIWLRIRYWKAKSLNIHILRGWWFPMYTTLILNRKYVYINLMYTFIIRNRQRVITYSVTIVLRQHKPNFIQALRTHLQKVKSWSHKITSNIKFSNIFCIPESFNTNISHQLFY